MFLMFSLLLWAVTDDPKDLMQQPIPQSVWEIKEDPSRNVHDAVIIHDFTKFTMTRTERFIRVRILNEKGKEAVDIIDTTGSLKLVGGKVTDANGKVTQFNKNEDLVEILSSKRGRRKEYNRILVPPALSENCVVDIAWYEAVDEGIPTDEYVKRYEVRKPYFAQKVQYIIDPTALRDNGNYFASRFSWFGGKDHLTFEASEDGKANVLTWTDVPAVEYQPFGVRAYDQIQAYIISYRVLPDLVMLNDPARFWRDFSQQFLKPMLQVKFRGAKDHEAWVNDLKGRLPEDPIQALELVAQEFRNRYHPHDLLTPEKRTRYVTHDSKTSDKVLYREITTHGFAQAYLMPRLFFTVLEKLDLEPQIILANSFYSHPFVPQEMNTMALNYLYPSFGYQREDGSWFLVNPGYAEYEPGETPPRYQGTTALAIDTANKWSVGSVRIPRLAPANHRVIREYTASLSEDLLLKQHMKVTLTGEPRARLRRQYFSMAEADKNDTLKSDWETYLDASSKVTEAKFEQMDTLAPNLGYNITWETQFHLDQTDNWIRLRPFTGSYTPLRNRDIWTKERTQPIVLSYAFDHQDKTTLQVPAGHDLRGNPSWQKTNGVGSVIFQAVQQANTITFERRIVLAVDIIGQQHANQVREFLAWIDEAESQQVVIERSQS